ncbi:MAG: TetR family transcriptional regulator [Tessaracoccus sp.]
MAKNDERRRTLADAGIRVLAREGARGLTHRAIDREAGVPLGTASNYFRSRAVLVEGLVSRVWEVISPTERDSRSVPGGCRTARSSPITFETSCAGSQHRDATIALFELRLESGRRPELEAIMGAWLRAGFDADVAFNHSVGLPGGRREIALFHYAIDGLLLDRLTASIDPDTSTDDVVDDLVYAIMPEKK